MRCAALQEARQQLRVVTQRGPHCSTKHLMEGSGVLAGAGHQVKLAVLQQITIPAAT